MRLEALGAAATDIDSAATWGDASLLVGLPFGCIPPPLSVAWCPSSVNLGRLDFALSFGALGGLTASLQSGLLSVQSPTLNVNGSGTFSPAGSTVGLAGGLLSYQGFGLAGAVFGNGSFDFSQGNLASTALLTAAQGTVSTSMIAPGVFEVDVQLPLSARFTLITSPGLLECVLDTTLSAQGRFILGDANGDGSVSGADFTVWNDNFGAHPGTATLSEGDFNCDGFVTGADFTIWADNFGRSIDPAQSVPESSSIAMAWIALIGLLPIAGTRRSTAAKGRG